jgi:hypothetical protein
MNESFVKFAVQNQLKKINMKKFTFLAVIALLFFTAGNTFSQDDKIKEEARVTSVTPEQFQEYAAKNVGAMVEIQGMVVHVCRHGGKKMFIIGEDPEMRVKIDASEKVSVFEPELEGSTVTVRGIIQPIVEEEVPESEKATQDADHTNYYHVPQYAISCTTFQIVKE